MVQEMVDRHPKLKRGDSKVENVVKSIGTDNSSVYHKVIKIFSAVHLFTPAGSG